MSRGVLLFSGIARQSRPRSSAEAIRRATDEIRRLVAKQVYDQLKAHGVVTTKRRNGTFAPEESPP